MKPPDPELFFFLEVFDYCFNLFTSDLSIQIFYFFFLNLFLFIIFWLHWVFVAVCRLSLGAASRGHSSLQCAGPSLQWLLLLQSVGSRCAGFSSCGMRAQQLWLTGSGVQAQHLWLIGLDAPWHVGPSQTKDQTCVPCIGRWTPNHCTTREVLLFLLDSSSKVV